MRRLLEKLLAHERRSTIAESHREALGELERGELEWSSDLDGLRSRLDG